MSWGVGRRGGSDPLLLWLWRRPAVTAPIGPLAWEPPYASGVALEKEKRQKKKTKKKTPQKTCSLWGKGVLVFLSSDFFFFLSFLGPLPRHMEVPRLGVKSEL